MLSYAKLALCLAVCIGAVLAGSDAPGDWTLVFEDDFKTLNLQEWRRADTNVSTNSSLQDYLPEQVTVEGGNLVITSEALPSRGLAYRSGQVVSKRSWKHGRFEVRAQLPTSTGMWPAIWLLPDVGRHPWPSGGEIDLVENRGNQPTISSSALHYGTNPPYKHSFLFQEQQTSRFGRFDNYHTEMHTYAVEWEPDQLRFYVDEVQHFSVYDDEVGGFLSKNVAPMNLIINTAIGGWFLDDPDGSTVLPQRLLVDSVKVYQRGGFPKARNQRNTGFEERGGSLAGWAPFNVRDTNVSISGEAVHDGVAALRLSGQNVGGKNYSGVSQGVSVETGQRVTATVNAIVRSAESLADTRNTAEMKLEFYSRLNGRHSTKELLGEEAITIANGTTAQDAWEEHALSATAPEGAVEARLAFVFVQPSGEPGAVYLDDIDFRALP